VRARIGSVMVAAILLLAGTAPALAGSTGSVSVKYSLTPIVKFSLTPNYNSGFGSVIATFGTQPAPTYGPNACLQGCSVDFGTVQAGSTYLYKYAAHINVTTNDINGFYVYGEGAADFTDGGGNTITLNQSLFYLSSVASGDTNTGFSAGLPFYATSGTVNPSSPSPTIAPTITYATYPAAILNASSSGTTDFYQDYQFKVPYSATASNYYVWIVYTVVPK
jgi:hypothetical protein